jgi:prophage regulatory protein
MTQEAKLLRLPDVQIRTGLSRSSVYQLEAQGSFPRRVVLGVRCVAWVAAEVDAWIESRIAERDSVQSLPKAAA